MYSPSTNAASSVDDESNSRCKRAPAEKHDPDAAIHERIANHASFSEEYKKDVHWAASQVESDVHFRAFVDAATQPGRVGAESIDKILEKYCLYQQQQQRQSNPSEKTLQEESARISSCSNGDAVEDDYVHVGARNEHLEAQITQLREQVASLRQRVDSLEANKESSASSELKDPQHFVKVGFHEQLGQQQVSLQGFKMGTLGRGVDVKPLFHSATNVPEEEYKRPVAAKVLETRRLIQQLKQQQEQQEGEHRHDACCSLGEVTATDKPRRTIVPPFGCGELSDSAQT